MENIAKGLKLNRWFESLSLVNKKKLLGVSEGELHSRWASMSVEEATKLADANKEIGVLTETSFAKL